MIVRTWRGSVRAEDANAYVDYLRQTGLAEYAATPGHMGTLGLRRTCGGKTDYLLLTFWRSPEAVGAFAGDDAARAVFYPEDERYLIAADATADHFEPFYADGSSLLPLHAPARAAGAHAGAQRGAAHSPGVSRPAGARAGWWWRGWVAYAADFARRGVGADFR